MFLSRFRTDAQSDSIEVRRGLTRRTIFLKIVIPVIIGLGGGYLLSHYVLKKEQQQSQVQQAEAQNEGPPPMAPEEAQRFIAAADAGDAYAQFRAGVIHQFGLGGFPKNAPEAVRYYKLAVDQKNWKAETNLGILYLRGAEGVPKDEVEAARLLQLGADANDTMAQYWLRQMRLDQNASSSDQDTQVPFVGCGSDGQVGELAPPTGGPKTIHAPASTASRLAYYKAENGPGVLGPRGWKCFGTYGSNGASLFVTPQPLKFPVEEIVGPAIQASASDAGTSGRLEVASIAARVFPSERAFVQQVIDEGLLRADQFPFGPYPDDRLKYQGDHLVEYETLGGSNGLGTMSHLAKGPEPIYGAAIFGDPGLLHLVIRPSPDLVDVVSPITRQFEQDYPSTK